MHASSGRPFDSACGGSSRIRNGMYRTTNERKNTRAKQTLYNKRKRQEEPFEQVIDGFHRPSHGYVRLAMVSVHFWKWSANIGSEQGGQCLAQVETLHWNTYWRASTLRPSMARILTGIQSTGTPPLGQCPRGHPPGHRVEQGCPERILPLHRRSAFVDPDQGRYGDAREHLCRCSGMVGLRARPGTHGVLSAKRCASDRGTRPGTSAVSFPTPASRWRTASRTSPIGWRM